MTKAEVLTIANHPAVSYHSNRGGVWVVILKPGVKPLGSRCFDDLSKFDNWCEENYHAQ